MKEETPFNPIVIPDLNLPTAKPVSPKLKTTSARKKFGTRKVSRVAKARRVLAAPRPAVRFTTRIRRKVRRLTQHIRGGITARLAHLDHDKLKKVLISCGVAAAIATTIVVVAKLTPLLVTLLGLLGLGAVLQLWDRLRSRIPA